MKQAQGIALILVAGVLALLSLTSVAMLRLASGLHFQMSSALDSADARLLARSGIEYAGARLSQDPSPKTPVTEGNQPDDWAYRDDPSVPLEKSLNPSYAQTEPYSDLNDNGRYDSSTDMLPVGSDRNRNGKFDSCSGRLRQQQGMSCGTFALKIGGQNTEGGINVNTGIINPLLDGDVPTYDLNRNHVPDYQDLGVPNPPPGSPVNPYFPLVTLGISAGVNWNPYDQWARNRRLAFAINQLGLLLGIATPRPGDRIVMNRPLGGYQSLDQAASLFPPPDWSRLQYHLSVLGRRNPYATEYLLDGASLWLQNSAGVRESDTQYLVNVQAAAPMTVAALFSNMQVTPYFGPQPIILPADAIRAESVLKGYEFVSWYDLYLKLLEAMPETSPWSPVAGLARISKATLVHALALPEEMGYEAPDSQLIAWSTYENRERREAKAWINDGEFSSKGGAASLDLGKTSLFSILSIGRMDALARRLAESQASALFQAEGFVRAGSQSDFENLRLDPSTRLYTSLTGFDGGVVAGRPSRDRTATYPCFSRDACPGFDQVQSIQVQLGSQDASTNGRTVTETIRNPGRYCDCFGEVTLQGDSWRDPGEMPPPVFYQPNWDLYQPDRPSPDPASFAFEQNFDDAAGDALFARAGGSGSLTSDDLKTGILVGGKIDMWDPVISPDPSSVRTGNGIFRFQWGAGGENPGDIPLAQEDGRVKEGTIEGWFAPLSGERVEARYNHGGGGNGSTIAYSTSSSQWSQYESGQSLPVYQWKNPVSASAYPDFFGRSPYRKSQFLAFAFDGEGMRAYVDGIRHGGCDFEIDPVDPAYQQRISNMSMDLRMYRTALDSASSAKIRAHAQKGRYWTGDPGLPSPVPGQQDLRTVPSFTSALYRFAAPTELARVGWDGFVSGVLRDAADSWHQSNPDQPKVPVRVELLLYRQGILTAIPLPSGSWRSGGARVDFPSLWKSLHPDEPVPKLDAFCFRVWMDASMLDLAWDAPIFDAFDARFKARHISRIRE